MRKRFFTLRNGLSSCCHVAVNRYNKYNELLLNKRDYVPEAEESYLSDYIDFDRDEATPLQIQPELLGSKNFDRVVSDRTVCSGCGADVSVKLGSKYPHVVKDWEGVLIGSQFRPVVRLVKMESKYKQVKGDRIIRKEEKHFFTFNYKTGRLYQVILGGKPKKVVRDGINIANMMRNMCKKRHIVRFIAECVKARAIHLFPEVDLLAIFGTDDIYKIARRYQHTRMSILFRILHLPDYAKIANLGNMGCIPKRMRKGLATATNPSEALDVIYNRPGKVFKKFIFGFDKPQAGMFYLLNAFNRDRLHTLFNARDLWEDQSLNLNHEMVMEVGTAIPFSPKGQVYLKELKQFVKAYGEERLINHLISNNTEKSRWGGKPSPFQYLGDSIEMYGQILTKAPDYEFPRQSSLKEMHDRLSVDNNKLRDPKQDIVYEEKELILNQEVAGVRFHAASDTYELFDVGAAMNICVGGYGNGAVEKHYFIVIGYVDDKPILCMQIGFNKEKNHKDTKDSVHDWFVNQAKLHNNSIVASNPDVMAAVRAWMDIVNAAGRTHDIKMTQEEQLAFNGRLYGNVLPNDDIHPDGDALDADAELAALGM